ncbi:hypothetical protein RFI_03416 [Reticulomyxa filosa]|uniref:ceramidase n=1 Tax=Reticulomyxa filosa TaxID=46433 RepID=X6P666_RETFI|nr:hypothetical protein RFI_03416 [Reticulomyxa filosa]|eukprot:ETO33686.1 hypothetical protein RFI_03416 [Reticulomyxa filosa]
MSLASDKIACPPFEIRNGLSNDAHLSLQQHVRKLQQEILSKTMTYDILVNRSEMVQKRLESKESRIKSLTAELQKLQQQLGEKREEELHLDGERMEDMQENVPPQQSHLKTKRRNANLRTTSRQSEREEESSKSQAQQEVLLLQQTNKKMEALDIGIEKAWNDLKQQMNAMEQNIKKIEQNNETWTQELFVGVNELMKDMKLQITQANKKACLRVNDNEEDDKSNRKKTVAKRTKTRNLWHDKWNEVAVLKTLCQDISGKFAQLQHLLPRPKDVNDLTLLVKQFIQSDSKSPPLSLQQWLKVQLSLMQTSASITSHLRQTLLTLVLRTFVNDFTWEPRLMEVQFRAEQFLSDARLNRDPFNHTSSNAIVAWCQELVNEKASAFIYVSSEALLYPVYCFFETINNSIQDTKHEMTSLVTAKATISSTKTKSPSASLGWLAFVFFFGAMFCFGAYVKKNTQVVYNGMYCFFFLFKAVRFYWNNTFQQMRSVLFFQMFYLVTCKCAQAIGKTYFVIVRIEHAFPMYNFSFFQTQDGASERVFLFSFLQFLRTMPWFDIDLDTDPYDRWKEVALTLKTEIQYLVDFVFHMDTFFEKDLLPIVEMRSSEILERMGSEYGPEIQGLADYTEIEVAKLIIVNSAYELMGLCTSIVAQNSDGTMYHGRNLDFGLYPGINWTDFQWGLTEALRPTLFNARMNKGGQVLYSAVFFGGNTTKQKKTYRYVGVLTGVRANAMSITVDSRYDDNYDKYLIDWYTHPESDLQFLTFTTRNAIENLDSYDAAVSFIMNTPLMCPAYVIIGGPNPTQGAVLTMGPNRTLEDYWNIPIGLPANDTNQVLLKKEFFLIPFFF